MLLKKCWLFSGAMFPEFQQEEAKERSFVETDKNLARAMEPTTAKRPCTP